MCFFFAPKNVKENCRCSFQDNEDVEYVRACVCRGGTVFVRVNMCF